MFDRNFFTGMKRSGMGVGLSKTKLAKMMIEILVQLPMGTTRLKETVVANLGLIGQMSTTRDLTAAWNEAKKIAGRDYPEKFILDGKKALQWNNGTVEIVDKKISAANFKKLNELAEIEGCTVNQFISKLLKNHKNQT